MTSAPGRFADAPLIVLGMHRSGTTMLAELLDRLGLFVGHELETNHEALYFLEVNGELFRRCNATWDQPRPVARFLEQRDAVDLTRRCVESDLRSKNVRAFVGWKRYWRQGGIDGLDEPWGFKDPRTVFTLPLWLELFPRAKIAYVVRNGVDVANSLLARERKRLAHQKEVFERRFARRSPEERLTRAAYRGSTRCLSFEGAFSLWEEYVERGEAVLEGVQAPVWRARYEDFCAKPRAMLAELASFAELAEHRDGDLELAAATVDATRSNAFKSAGASVDVERALRSPWMKRFEYA